MSGGLTSSRFRFLRSGIVFVVVVALASLTFLLKPQSLEAPKLSGSTNSLPMAKPEEVGFSAERLQRVTDAMQKHIDAGEIAGVTALIARNGKIVYFNAKVGRYRREEVHAKGRHIQLGVRHETYHCHGDSHAGRTRQNQPERPGLEIFP